MKLNKQKKDLKKKNNIKGMVIVENDEEESSEDEFEGDAKGGKIDEIYNSTMSEFNKTQKEAQRVQKEKEAAALAKLDILKAEKSKNKIMSSAGKGLVTNNLSSKLKSLSQKKEYDAQKLVEEESKSIISKLPSSSVKDKINIPIKRKKIMLKGRQIGVIDFNKAALK